VPAVEDTREAGATEPFEYAVGPSMVISVCRSWCIADYFLTQLMMRLQRRGPAVVAAAGSWAPSGDRSPAAGPNPGDP
jgi:hypothetical protein